MMDGTPRYMESTKSWARRARSPSGVRPQVDRIKRLQSSSGRLEGVLRDPEAQEQMTTFPLLEDVQAVQKTLASRLVKLDEGLRERDVQLAELRTRYQEAQKASEEWRTRAHSAEEDVIVLRRMLHERTEEIQRLKLQASPSA
mmetsp:Transcript_33323/g.76844  ORF Transcript_33323/g.76844 Transcript_33323/m.76844 type:complete len:143 (-) Transcript_33323:244-672(-)